MRIPATPTENLRPAPARGEATVEVAGGKPAAQSSALGKWGDAGQAVAGQPTGRFAFHTAVEDRPWWEVDLEDIVPLRCVVVWNREDLATAVKARPLRVLVSRDHLAWSVLARIDYVFGGLRSGRPLVLNLAEPVPTRYVRIEIEGRAALHLDQVQVFAGAPALYFARVSRLRRDGPGWRARIFSRRGAQAGFFSICSTLLESVLDLRRHGIETEEIDCSAAFTAFRDGPEPPDLYPALFRPDPSVALPSTEVPGFLAVRDCHVRYRDLDLPAFSPFLRRYFGPSDAVVRVERELVARYGLEFDALLALWYRGTDKYHDIAPTDIRRYIALADSILAREPSLRVLVQTDQAQIRDAVVKHFGERCVFFEEMPVTTGEVAMHKLDLAREHGVSKLDFARTLLASVRILARCRHLITHTGNVGLWLALHRGTAAGLQQFDQHQRLVPSPPT